MPCSDRASPFLKKKIKEKHPYPLTHELILFIFGSFGLKDQNKTTGVVAQFWLEHRPVTPEVASSSLVYPAKKASL